MEPHKVSNSFPVCLNSSANPGSLSHPVRSIFSQSFRGPDRQVEDITETEDWDLHGPTSYPDHKPPLIVSVDGFFLSSPCPRLPLDYPPNSPPDFFGPLFDISIVDLPSISPSPSPSDCLVFHCEGFPCGVCLLYGSLFHKNKCSDRCSTRRCVCGIVPLKSIQARFKAKIFLRRMTNLFDEILRCIGQEVVESALSHG